MQGESGKCFQTQAQDKNMAAHLKGTLHGDMVFALDQPTYRRITRLNLLVQFAVLRK